MNCIKNHIQGNFTIVPNELINDTRLKATSRFIYVYLASKPNDWEFRTHDLCKKIRLHIDTMRKYRGELVEFGWIHVEKQLNRNGVFNYRVYHIYGNPKDNIHHSKADKGKPDDGKLPSSNSTDSESFRVGNNSVHSNTQKLQTENNYTKKDFFNQDIEIFNPNPRE